MCSLLYVSYNSVKLEKERAYMSEDITYCTISYKVGKVPLRLCSQDF